MLSVPQDAAGEPMNGGRKSSGLYKLDVNDVGTNSWIETDVRVNDP